MNGFVELIGTVFWRGGSAVVAVFLVSTVMWYLILERYWFLARGYPRLAAEAARRWQARPERHDWTAHRVREALIADLSLAGSRHLALIDVMILVLPMLGLLGTVLGMISTFESMTNGDTGNVRQLTAGIDHALVSTLCGLVTALSGWYLAADLHQRYARARNAAVLALTGA